MELQTTIKEAFTLAGPGLHLGGFNHATVRPAAANTGIRFRRCDLNPAVEIPAHADRVGGPDHGTTLKAADVPVATIEHLMSALHGMRIDNAIIDLDGPEVPILDGSARLWVEAIGRVGIVEQEAERRYYRLSQPVEWSDPQAGIVMRAEPADDFRIDSEIRFSSSLIGNQSATLTDYGQYVSEFARCRTFVFLREVEMLLSLNLIKGGDLDNALVFVDKPLEQDEKERLAVLFGKDASGIQVRDGVLNTVVPYYPNEPARHKLLDFMGDIALVGMPVKAHFHLVCPGHRANVALATKVRELMLAKN